MINFHISSKYFFQKREEWSDLRVVSITKKKKVLLYIFYKNSKSFERQYLMND